MTILDDLLRPVPTLTPEKAVEPAKRWKNKWFVLSPLFGCVTCGAPSVEPGKTIWGCHLEYVSKDVAETDAQERLKKYILQYGFSPVRFEGAHPWEGDE